MTKQEIWDEVLRIVSERIGKDKAPLWMYTPNPNLGQASPSEMICLDRGEKLLRWVRAMANRKSVEPCP